MTDPSRVICIIPARGGSKRVPGKNLVVVAGKPLIIHTVEQALLSEVVGRVVVSTDSDEIARVAMAHGAEVVRRPPGLSGDTASSEAALLHALDVLETRGGYVPELVVFLQCTAPIRSANDIDRAVAVMQREKADSVLSVVEKKMFLWTIQSGRPEPLNYDVGNRPRSQDMAPVYIENGSIYVLKPAVLRAHNNRLGGRVSIYVMPEESAIDVDSPFDLDLCKFVLERRRT